MKKFEKKGTWKPGFGKPSFGKPSFGRGGSDRGSDRAGTGSATMHSATCKACGNSCQVPFKPNGKKPVFCSNCFTKEDKAPARRFDAGARFERGGGEEKRMFQSVCEKCGKECEVPFRPTGEKPVYCFNCFRKTDYGDEPVSPSGSNSDVARELEIINSKLDKILKALKPKKETGEKEVHQEIDFE